LSKQKINQYIDHTILKPESTREQVIEICKEAKENGFASVCINTCFTKLVAEQLKGTEVKTCVTVGFPLGCNSTKTKVFEAKDAIDDGANEVDMVINVGVLKSGDVDYVKNEISEIVQATKGKAILKVILETCLLSDEEIIEVCKISKEVGADFVKTSTGFNSAGATIEHIKLMRITVGEEMGIKAAGGIRSYEKAIAMIEAGATRVGASSSLKIIKEQDE
jgi:deoxyribose-phosphate aldolase